MSKIQNITVIGLVLLTTPFAAYAQKSDGKGQGQPAQADQKPVTWDDFKARCQDPTKFRDVQVSPVNIKLDCQESVTHFVAATPGEVPLPARATIVTSVLSDKFTVTPQAYEVTVPDRAGSCQRFVEVTESYETQRPVSCLEVLNYKGDLKDFCQQVVSAGKSANSKGVQIVSTGRVIDTCAGTAAVDTTGGKPQP